MKYKINEDVMDTTFRVPRVIVEKHIRLANEHQLKVLLWILRYSPDNPDIEKMCKDLKMKPDDAGDYLQYWVLTGVLEAKADGDDAKNEKPEKKAAQSKTVSAAPAVSVPAPAQEIPRSKPTSVEIQARTQENPEIAMLMNEAQKKLGRTIGYEYQATLLMLHDFDGLPVEVIYMLLDYCVSINKTHCAYLAAVGKDWGAKEIDTIEKAAEKITALRTSDKLWSEFAPLAGIKNPRPTTKQTEYLNRWSREWGFSGEMIFLAYEQMADHTQSLSFAYMDKVLASWHNEGIKTPKAVKEAAVKKTSKPAAKPSGTASYDLDAFDKKALYGDLDFERKKK